MNIPSVSSVKESDLDQKTKLEKVKQLEEQIAEIDKQIQEAKAKEQQKKLQEA